MSRLQLLPARYYAHLCDVLARLGHNPAPLLRAAGVCQREIQNPDGLITLAQMETFLDAARQTTGRTDLALELAQALQLTSHSVVSYGMLSSPSLGYCLNLVARYFRLIKPCFRMEYACDRRHMRLTVEPVWPLSRDALAFHLEAIAVSIYRQSRELLGGPMPVCRLYFSIDRPPHAHRYDGFHELRTEFGWHALPRVRLEWPAEVAGRPLAMADPHALKLAEQRCAELLNRARAAGRVSNWVSMMLREANGRPPSQQELANALNLSPRTLDRQLKREGTSFRDLHQQAREQKACRLLREGRLSVTQVAYEVGYSDASNFIRAFKRQTGHSPTEWRGNIDPQHRPSADR